MGGTTESSGSLGKGLAVIACLSDARGEGLRLSDVAERVPLTRATARRLLLQLCELGYARQAGRLFHPTERVTALTLGMLGSRNPWTAAQPVLAALADRLGESVSVGVLDGTRVRYVARAAVTHVLSVNLDVGSALPAAYTSMGRVLLAALPPERARALVAGELRAHTPRSITALDALMAELERVAAAGVATVDQELEPGLRSVAVPISDASGTVVAAVNAGTSASRHALETIEGRFADELRTAAVRIGETVAARHAKDG